MDFLNGTQDALKKSMQGLIGDNVSISNELELPSQAEPSIFYDGLDDAFDCLTPYLQSGSAQEDGSLSVFNENPTSSSLKAFYCAESLDFDEFLHLLSEKMNNGDVDSKDLGNNIERKEGDKSLKDLNDTKKTSTPSLSALGLNPAMNREEIIGFVDSLNADNIVELLDEFESNSTVGILEYLEAVGEFDADELKQMQQKIEGLLCEKYGFDPNFSLPNSQVVNQFYQGDAYSITQNGNILTTVNQATGEVTEVDISRFVVGVNTTQRYQIYAQLQQLPGELLADLITENAYITSAESSKFGGFYDGYGVAVKGSSAGVVAHEVGHSFDHLFDDTHYNGFMFEGEYADEISAMYASGLCGDYSAGGSESEVFAECYRYLMGFSDPKMVEVYETYLPKTLARVAQIIKEVHSLPKNARSNAKTLYENILNMPDDIFNQFSHSVHINCSQTNSYPRLAFSEIEYSCDENGVLKGYFTKIGNQKFYQSCTPPYMQIEEYLGENGTSIGFYVSYKEGDSKVKMQFHADGTIDKEYLFDNNGKQIGYIQYVRNQDGTYSKVTHDNTGKELARIFADSIPPDVSSYYA